MLLSPFTWLYNHYHYPSPAFFYSFNTEIPTITSHSPFTQTLVITILLSFKIIFIFGCAGSSLLPTGFFGWDEQGLLFIAVRAFYCGGFSCCWARAPGAKASGVVAQGLSCSVTCEVFLDQGSNLCLLLHLADSLPLSHWGSPDFYFDRNRR